MNNTNNDKNCRPQTWFTKILRKYFNIVLTCDQRCQYHLDAPCQYTNEHETTKTN